MIRKCDNCKRITGYRYCPYCNEGIYEMTVGNVLKLVGWRKDHQTTPLPPEVIKREGEQ